MGIVTPVNWWELPAITRNFLSRMILTLSENNYVFVVVTYGTTPGYYGKDAKRVLKTKNIQLDASFSVQMRQLDPNFLILVIQKK